MFDLSANKDHQMCQKVCFAVSSSTACVFDNL